MSRYTRLEQAVMSALAHDLRGVLPDLDAQFDGSQPSQRRNSGFGLFTEMLVDRARPGPVSGPTGDLGSVHAMVGKLADPIAFRVRVRNGVLLGLLGDSYGQDTRAIDFATTPFDQVFTVDADGVSVPFQFVRSTTVDASRDAVRKPNWSPSPATAAPPRTATTARRAPQVDREVRQAPPPQSTPSPITPPSPGGKLPTDDASLLIGMWVLIAVVALIVVTIFGLPLAMGVIFAIVLGRAVKNPKTLAHVRKVVDDWQSGLSSS